MSELFYWKVNHYEYAKFQMLIVFFMDKGAYRISANSYDS